MSSVTFSTSFYVFDLRDSIVFPYIFNADVTLAQHVRPYYVQCQHRRASADSLPVFTSIRLCAQLPDCSEIPSAGPPLSCLSSLLFTLHAWLPVRG